jgi:ribose transport system substrate-binding protein
MQTQTFMRFLLPGVVLSFAMSMGCSSSPHNPAEKYILLSVNKRVPYWQTAFAGLNQAAGEMGVKAEMDGPDNYNPQAEHQAFLRAIQEKPSGILVSASDAALLTPDINSALEQGIPVITVDSDAPDSKRLFFVGTDNYNAGTLGGRLVAKLLNGRGNVAILTIPAQPNLKDRLHGYKDAFADHPDLKVAEVVDIKGDPTVAFDSARRLLESKPRIDAFVCLESISCPEVGEVVNRENMVGKVTIVAMDTDERTINWIQKGVISATIAQKPFTMAYYGTKLIDDIHHHPPKPLTADWAENPSAPIPTFVDTGSFIVDKSNVQKFLQQNNTANGQSQQAAQ